MIRTQNVLRFAHAAPGCRPAVAAANLDNFTPSDSADVSFAPPNRFKLAAAVGMCLAAGVGLSQAAPPAPQVQMQQTSTNAPASTSTNLTQVAQDSKAHQAGKKLGETGKKIAEPFKDAGLAIGHTGRDVGLKIGHTFRDFFKGVAGK